jgi:hypothetical protein
MRLDSSKCAREIERVTHTALQMNLDGVDAFNHAAPRTFSSLLYLLQQIRVRFFSIADYGLFLFTGITSDACICVMR